MNHKDPIYKLHRKDVVLRAGDFLNTLKCDSRKNETERAFYSAESARDYGAEVIKELLELLEGGPE